MTIDDIDPQDLNKLAASVMFLGKVLDRHSDTIRELERHTDKTDVALKALHKVETDLSSIKHKTIPEMQQCIAHLRGTVEAKAVEVHVGDETNVSGDNNAVGGSWGNWGLNNKGLALVFITIAIILAVVFGRNVRWRDLFIGNDPPAQEQIEEQDNGE